MNNKYKLLPHGLSHVAFFEKNQLFDFGHLRQFKLDMAMGDFLLLQ
jgi:hypothetical protein